MAAPSIESTTLPEMTPCVLCGNNEQLQYRIAQKARLTLRILAGYNTFRLRALLTAGICVVLSFAASFPARAQPMCPQNSFLEFLDPAFRAEPSFVPLAVVPPGTNQTFVLVPGSLDFRQVPVGQTATQAFM